MPSIRLFWLPLIVVALAVTGCKIISSDESPIQITFDQPRLTAMEVDAPKDVVAADIDGDEDQDLIVVHDIWRGITFMLNNGSGSFTESRRFNPNGFSSAHSLRTYDIDNDGDLDLMIAVGSSEATFQLAINDGSGEFELQTFFLAEHGLSMGLVSLAADYDGDGNTDILIKSERGRKLVLLRNKGGGVFEPSSVDLPADYDARVFVQSDLNADGALDLILADYTNRLFRLENVGNMRFEEAGHHMVGMYPQQAIAGDFDGDGRTDLIVAAEGSTALTGLKETGWSRSSPMQTLFAQFAQSGDFGGSATPEIALLEFNQESGRRILIYSHLRKGEFELSGEILLDQLVGCCSSHDFFAVADFNRDGLADIAIPDYLSKRMTVYLNSSDH